MCAVCSTLLPLFSYADEMELDKRFIAPERFTTRSEEANDLALEKVFYFFLLKLLS